jgi:hypothetical protein
MRSRAIPALGLSVVALALATSLAGTANAASGPSASHSGTSAATIHGPDAACFSNMGGDTGVAIVSQNFEAAFDAYDAAGADDVKLRRRCAVHHIDVAGQYFNGSGPAASETVTFYKDASGSPGAVIKTQTVTGADTAGSFSIPLSTVKLRGHKTYWVSVQANLDFSVGGEWGWENTTDAKKLPAMWENPGDGFATGCTTWGNMQSCLGGTAPGPDFMFAISK